MVAFKNLLFLASMATAMVLEPRTPAQVLTSLKTIDADVRTLTSSINSWDGTVNGGVTIQNNEQKVEKDIDASTSIASKEPQASSADTKNILSYVTGTLEPDINSSITALINKKSQFVAVGLKSTVQNDLTSLRSKSEALANALIKAASNDQKTAATNAKNKILADIDRGIAAFK